MEHGEDYQNYFGEWNVMWTFILSPKCPWVEFYFSDKMHVSLPHKKSSIPTVIAVHSNPHSLQETRKIKTAERNDDEEEFIRSDGLLQTIACTGTTS